MAKRDSYLKAKQCSCCGRIGIALEMYDDPEPYEADDQVLVCADCVGHFVAVHFDRAECDVLRQFAARRRL